MSSSGGWRGMSATPGSGRLNTMVHFAVTSTSPVISRADYPYGARLQVVEAMAQWSRSAFSSSTGWRCIRSDSISTPRLRSAYDRFMGIGRR